IPYRNHGELKQAVITTFAKQVESAIRSRAATEGRPVHRSTINIGSSYAAAPARAGYRDSHNLAA
ncbi:hypothetical protein EVAR_40007_1, partial [Eumeta japonica]